MYKIIASQHYANTYGTVTTSSAQSSTPPNSSQVGRNIAQNPSPGIIGHHGRELNAYRSALEKPSLHQNSICHTLLSSGINTAPFTRGGAVQCQSPQSRAGAANSPIYTRGAVLNQSLPAAGDNVRSRPASHESILHSGVRIINASSLPRPSSGHNRTPTNQGHVAGPNGGSSRNVPNVNTTGKGVYAPPIMSVSEKVPVDLPSASSSSHVSPSFSGSYSNTPSQGWDPQLYTQSWRRYRYYNIKSLKFFNFTSTVFLSDNLAVI